jgi:hypothetical protein
MTTHFSNITNIASSHGLRELPAPFPAKMHAFFDDFDRYVAAEWDVTETQAGATQALTPADGGKLLLTNSAADNDVNSVQVPVASFLITGNKKAYFGARFQVSDAVDSDVVIGMALDQGAAATLTPTHGIFFRKSDDAANIVGVVRNAGVETVTATLLAIAAATEYDVFWHYNGADAVEFEVRLASDGSLVGRASVVLTNLPSGTLLAPIAFLQNGAAAAKTLTIDYLFAAKER